MKNPGLLSARVGEELLAAVDAVARERVNPDGSTLQRTDATKQALRLWISADSAGVYYPTSQERAVLEGLRRRRATSPIAVEALYTLAESLARSERVADAISRLAPLFEAFAATPPENRPPTQEPQQSPGLGAARKRR